MKIKKELIIDVLYLEVPKLVTEKNIILFNIKITMKYHRYIIYHIYVFNKEIKYVL